MKIVTEYNDLIYEAIDVIGADYLGEYKIKLEFVDNTSRTIDFYSFLNKSQHPSIKKYLDKSLFQLYEIVDGNLSWNNNDLIFPLEDLYEGNI